MPGMFEWCRLFASSDELTVLKLRGTEVARLVQKVSGEWHAALNQHLPGTDPRRRYRDCRSFETGKAGVEEWARRHSERIDREVAEMEAKRKWPR